MCRASKESKVTEIWFTEFHATFGLNFNAQNHCMFYQVIICTRRVTVLTVRLMVHCSVSSQKFFCRRLAFATLRTMPDSRTSYSLHPQSTLFMHIGTMLLPLQHFRFRKTENAKKYQRRILAVWLHEQKEQQCRAAAVAWDRAFINLPYWCRLELSENNSQKACSAYPCCKHIYSLLASQAVIRRASRSWRLQRPREDCYKSFLGDERDKQHSTWSSWEAKFLCLILLFGKEDKAETSAELGEMDNGPSVQVLQYGRAGARYLRWYFKNCEDFSGDARSLQGFALWEIHHAFPECAAAARGS